MEKKIDKAIVNRQSWINCLQRLHVTLLMKKIVIIGPESTGKSRLCTQLANHYKTSWVPEYARQYLLTHGTDYTFNDLLVIAKGQVALEDAYTKSLLLTIDDA